MGEWLKRAFGLALSAVLVAGIVPAAAFGAGEQADLGLVAQGATDERMTVSGAVRYEDAYTLVGLINEKRTAAGKQKLELDKELTKASMQRAAELSVFYSHTRPNGEVFSTAIPPERRLGITEEVSGIDLSSPDDFINACLNDPVNRAYIMQDNLQSVGIGTFSQGATCWNLLLSTEPKQGVVDENTGNKTYSFYVDYSVCGKTQAFNLNTPLANMQQLNVGQTFRMDYSVKNDGRERIFARLDPKSVDWSSSNPAVCTVDAQTGTVTARAAGTATITAKLGSGKSISHAWSVSQEIASVAPTTVPDQIYTGAPVEPRPTIMSGNRALVEGTDYAVSYSYNTNVGVASMTITGMGSFTGTRTLQFRIQPAQNWVVTLSETQYLYDGTEKKPAVTVTHNGRTLVEAVNGRGDYTVVYPGDMKSLGNHTITVMAMGNYGGEQAANYSITEEPVSSESYDVMYRLYNPNSGEHFYTASVGERDAIAGAGWNYEGVGWIAPKSSRAPVYRLYSGTDHHYTTNAEERDALIGAGWTLEGEGGIAWYSEDSGDDAKRIPLYRQFNPNVDPTAAFNNSGSHNYTMSKSENDTLVQGGWIEEGIGWYGIRQ